MATEVLIAPKMIRAGNAAALLALLGGLLVVQVPLPDPLILLWLLVLVVGRRSAVRVWSGRRRRQTGGG